MIDRNYALEKGAAVLHIVLTALVWRVFVLLTHSLRSLFLSFCCFNYFFYHSQVNKDYDDVYSLKQADNGQATDK